MSEFASINEKDFLPGILQSCRLVFPSPSVRSAPEQPVQEVAKPSLWLPPRYVSAGHGSHWFVDVSTYVPLPQYTVSKRYTE